MFCILIKIQIHISLFFFFSRMYGLFQTVFYFGYMALFSLALGIMCGKSNTAVKQG